MGHLSTPSFRTFHALRIKGFANLDTLAEITALELNEVESHVQGLAGVEHAQFRENRGLWQLTPAGREAHGPALAADLDGIDAAQLLASAYPGFVGVNVRFKELCGAWQLRGDAPNDHTDTAYDDGVIEQLAAMNEEAQPLVVAMGESLDRMNPYATRLDSALDRLRAGASNMFTGVMCNSYHDIWMELHEDLILTQGIDRSAEGSF
jgi:hypothetical protein